MPTDVCLRPAEVRDLSVLAEVHLAARAGAGGSFPPAAHSVDEVRAWIHSWDLGSMQVWLATLAGRVVGYARWTPTWLDDLYVLPDAQGQGVGSALLDLVKSQLPAGFGLWVFESNEPAHDFYASHGLVRLERTDGSANEERAPDIKLVWPGQDPLAYFRSMIDEVDLVLGEVLARRTALTRVVQDHKRTVSGDAVPTVGEPARDLGREAEIIGRVAALAPELGEARVARIVQAIITEALGAHQPPRN